MDSGIRSARNVLFLELKEPCVELSKLALRDDGTRDGAKVLFESSARLLDVLESKCRRTDGVFDQKLADYVFFPLSQILRRKAQHTDQLSELTLKCLCILLEYGWTTLDLDLGKQLLLLLTFIAGGVPGRETPVASEEVQSTAYNGLKFLFRILARTPGGASILVETATLPALGHCITVLLDGSADGPSPEVQLQALGALEAAWKCIKNEEALATFLPGTISGLTKCLTPSTANRRTHATIMSALKVLQNVLVSVLGDIQTRKIRAKDLPANEPSLSSSHQRLFTPAWLKATTGQIKLALSNVVRLRRHSSSDVRVCLNDLCLKLLDECHDTLQDSAALLVETSMILDDGTLIAQADEMQTTLVNLATIYPDILEHIKSIVYSWVTSLPRVMQANDETGKITALIQLSKAHGLFSSLGVDSSILQEALASSLRDSITLTLDTSTTSKFVKEAAFTLDSQAAMTLVSESSDNTNFQPLFMRDQSQLQTLKHFESLLAKFGSKDARILLARNMLDYSRGATGNSLLSSFWLSANIFKSAIHDEEIFDDFLQISQTVATDVDQANEELFSYALSALNDQDKDLQDWRMQAIALEIMAFTSQRRKQDFRVDLVDVLYPVTQLLGSSEPGLRDHAITCLNVISTACGYQNAGNLIIENADYMVNAISLRLNTFDLSPSTPQVLVMMIRLAGPSLLLYLDDVVSSIFAALDNFHGYTLLVESLFSVLGEVVSVGASADTSIKDKDESHISRHPPTPTISDILSILSVEKRSAHVSGEQDREDFPHKPWKSAKTLLDEADKAAQDSGSSDAEDAEQPPTEIVPVPTKTHTLLHNITQQTQHHLTSSSPTMRTKLLSLIRTSILSLSPSSPDFLPLINDIWPVVILRLYDTEPPVQIAAAETISALCRAAGDFLGTRFTTEWSTLTAFVKTTKQAVIIEKQGKGGRGAFSMARRVWDALITLLGDVVGYVGVSDKMFDDVLGAIGEAELRRRTDVRELLESGKGNADSVWLQQELLGSGTGRKRISPQVQGYEFVSL